MPYEAKADFAKRIILYIKTASYLKDGPRVISMGIAVSRKSKNVFAGFGANGLLWGDTGLPFILVPSLQFLKFKKDFVFIAVKKKCTLIQKCRRTNYIFIL